MKLLLLFFPPLCLLLPRPLPLWMCKGLGLVQGCVVETVIGTVPVLSHMPCLSPRQPEAPAGQGILGAQGPAGGRGGAGQEATHLCWSPQTSPMCQMGRGECDCVRVRMCARIFVWDCAFEGPGAGRAAERGALLWLENLTPPWACVPAWGLPECLRNLCRL